MATSSESDCANDNPDQRGQPKYPVTIQKMVNLLSLTDGSRTRLPESYDPFSELCSKSLISLELNETNKQSEYPIYFCTEKSLESLDAVVAYCSSYRSKRDRSFTFSSYFTLIMNLCPFSNSSSELFVKEINNSLKLPKCFVANLKSFTDGKSMLEAMIDDNFVDNVSETLDRHQKILKCKYENLLCVVGYLFLNAFDKCDELPMQKVLEPFVDAVGAFDFATYDLKRSTSLSEEVKQTFEDEFGFRKTIFKHLVSLATLENQLGIVSRLVVEELRFFKIEKVFLIQKYVRPYVPSILNFPTLEHPLYRSAFIRMDQSFRRFDDCEKPFIWFLEEHMDDFTCRGLDLFVAYALAIRSYEGPGCEYDRFSENVDAFYELRKEDVFQYLRQFSKYK